MNETVENSNPLPPLYTSIEALSPERHSKLSVDYSGGISAMASMNAVPLTIAEFPQVQRNMPIVFAAGENPVPLGLMGISPEWNVFADESGVPRSSLRYIPAYLRRYPFLLVQGDTSSEELTLCIDPSANVVNSVKEGHGLFEDGKPSEFLNNKLTFCSEYEKERLRTSSFVKVLQEFDLLEDSQSEMKLTDFEKPVRIRGFQIISAEKLNAVSAANIKALQQKGVLDLIALHRASLTLISDITSSQLDQGWNPTD